MNAAGSSALGPPSRSAAGSSAVLAASSPSAGSAYTSRDSNAGGIAPRASHGAGVRSTIAAPFAPAPSASSANTPRSSANDIAVQNLHVDQPSARPVTTSKQQLSHSDVLRPSQPHAAVIDSVNAPGPAFEPLILASDDTNGTMSSRQHKKRQVGGISMGIGVLVGALAIALIVLAFFLYRRVRRRREEKWRRRRLTHVDPGSRVGEHVDGEKIPVSPFLAGSPQWPRNRVLHISSENFLEFDEEAGPAETQTPRSGDVLTPRTGDPLLQAASSPTPSSSTLLVPAQSSPGPTSAQTSGSHGSNRAGRARTPPAALALSDTPTSSTNAARHSHGDGAVEFTLHPPSTGSASTSNGAPRPRRNSIEKRPERTLVAHNALTPPPPTTPMRTPAPRYSRGLWGRLSGLRQSIVPPAYESPRPERTTHATHLAVPYASHVQWAPMRVEEPGPSEPPPHPFAARRI
ncbi:hypothetical protein AURDEDRAFT_114245 [Auricularia subglabra TFB-10046 SS5]|nr:hypothetical protein AURDEDRAFT_114245 [Auricularia subglabra TFB-10046 SS5]